MKIGKFSEYGRIAVVAAGLFLAFSVPQANAEDIKKFIVDIIPAHDATGESPEATPFKDDEATHPPLRVTTDKSELVRLDRDAASVILGNPLHVNVVADSVRTLVVIPRSPGATYFTVLDRDGNVVMQRHVIVGSPKEDYVRVKRACNKEAGANCHNTSIFYCPDMCHEIGSQEETDSSSSTESTDLSDSKTTMDAESTDASMTGEDNQTQ